jgi:hypothetical protein
MPTSEVARLARRVDHLDETMRAISDTLLDIKDTQDRHTEALGELTGAVVEVRGIRGIVDGHTEALAEVTGAVVQVRGIVDGHTEALAEVTGAVVQVRGIVDDHTEALGGVQSTLGQHGELLSEILRRLDRVAS